MPKSTKRQVFNPEFLRTNSVPGPSAQYTRLLQLQEPHETIVTTYLARIDQCSYISNAVKAYAMLLFTSGIRISELISIRGSNVSTDGSIHLIGSKGSHDRIIEPIFYREEFIKLKEVTYPISTLYSRWFFYRLFKKLDIVNRHKDGSRNSVTHSGRELYIKKIKSLSSDLETTKRAVGHKSKNSTKIYINKK